MTAIEATWWLNEHLEEWLGEKNVADALAQSVPHNVTSEMGLALLDVADAIRPHPEVVAYLRRRRTRSFLDVLPTLEGGREARGCDSVRTSRNTGCAAPARSTSRGRAGPNARRRSCR